VVNISTLPKALANPALLVPTPLTVPRVQMNATFALQEPLLLTLAPTNAPSALLALLKTTEPNVFPALLVLTPSKLLKTLKNAILAPLVPSPRTMVHLFVLDVLLVLGLIKEPNVFLALLVNTLLTEPRPLLNATIALLELSPRLLVLLTAKDVTLVTTNWTDCPAKLAPLVLSSLPEVRMLLNANLVLMVMSPETMVHLHVKSVDMVPMLALVKLLAIIVPSEPSLLLVEWTTVLPALQDLLPNLKALTPAPSALLALMNKTEPLVTTALPVPSLLLMVLLIFLNVRLAQLELSPETPEPLLALSALLVVMPSIQVSATTALLVPSPLKEPEISMTVLPALLEVLPRILDQLTVPSALPVITNSTEPHAIPAPWVLSLLKLLLVLANAKPAPLVPW
jgi:hypothetical protein